MSLILEATPRFEFLAVEGVVILPMSGTEHVTENST